MPYMLKPHNYSQVMRPNLYNVNYGRVGAYKGMGGLGQLLPGGPGMWAGGGDGPDMTTFTSDGQTYRIDAAGNVYLMSSGGPIPVAGGTEPVVRTTQQMPQTQNYLPWIVGGFVLLLLLGRRR
jgi:hypothetical protein